MTGLSPRVFCLSGPPMLRCRHGYVTSHSVSKPSRDTTCFFVSTVPTSELSRYLRTRFWGNSYMNQWPAPFAPGHYLGK